MNALETEIDNLFNLKNSKELFRLGKLFSTKHNNYYYDVGTGKVMMLDDGSANLLSFLFNEDDNRTVSDFESSLSENESKEICDFLETIKHEKLFLAPKLKKLQTLAHGDKLEENVNNNLGQVILELTGTCNLRCRYCYYNEAAIGTRNFNNKNMSKEIAKAAIDYANAHSSKELAVTFYGGEPLIRFDLLKWSIEYAKETIKDKELTFAFTTNLTLVTEEIAEYLASVNGLSVLCSLDGPEEVQNNYRKYINGQGTFPEAIRGLKLLVEKFKKNPNNTLAINAVFAPPYTYENIENINSFFKSIDWLPQNVEVRLDYVGTGSIDDRDHIQELLNDAKYVSPSGYFIDSLGTWGEKQFKNYEGDSEDFHNMYKDAFQKKLLTIHSRAISDEPMEKYPFNSCCIPCSRRIYVDTDGNFSLCEKMGDSPDIGNVHEGLNFKNLKKYYIDDYSEQSTEDCSKCWAIRFCSHCYEGNYTKEGFNIETKRTLCNAMRFAAEKKFILYHSILEENPEKLRFLNNIEVK